MNKFLIVLLTLLLNIQQASAFSFDTFMDKNIAPVSDAIADFIFHPIHIFGTDVPIIIFWILLAGVFFTFYLRGIAVWGFKHAIDLLVKPKKSGDGSGEGQIVRGEDGAGSLERLLEEEREEKDKNIEYGAVEPVFDRRIVGIDDLVDALDDLRIGGLQLDGPFDVFAYRNQFQCAGIAERKVAVAVMDGRFVVPDAAEPDADCLVDLIQGHCIVAAKSRLRVDAVEPPGLADPEYDGDEGQYE